MRLRIGISSNLLYALSAICMAAGAIGASMLAPFYMDAKGFPLAVVGMPLLVNGSARCVPTWCPARWRPISGRASCCWRQWSSPWPRRFWVSPSRTA